MLVNVKVTGGLNKEDGCTKKSPGKNRQIKLGNYLPHKEIHKILTN